MDALLLSFGVIFVAELGDKSQLLALAFAARYRPLPVLVGITISAAVVHAVSVTIGGFFGDVVAADALSIVAGAAFLGFGLWTLRGEEDEGEETSGEAATPARSGRSAVITVTVAFILAELGDKTMLATITLATNQGALGTWAGATLGMVTADALAVAAGGPLAARVPARVIRIGAASAFFAVGAVLIVTTIW